MYTPELIKQMEKSQKANEAFWTRLNFIKGIMSGRYRHMQIKNKIKRAKRA